MFLLSRFTRRLGIQHQPSAKSLMQPYPPKEALIAGRRHRVDTPYLLPKDDLEIHRLDFQHHALYAVLGSNYEAPLDPATTKTILDVGSGTGRWVIETARAQPQAQLFGIDIEVPTFSTPPPPNCTFYGGNVLTGIPFAQERFDYVHQRLLVGAIPAVKWPFVLQELARVTRVGGWIELLESGDIYHNMGPSHHFLKKTWDAGIAQTGFDLSLMPHLDILLENAGLKNIKMRTVSMPLGKWAGRSGELMAIDIYNVFKSFKGFYTSKLNVSEKDFDAALAALPGEWEKHHTTYDFYLVYGQK